MTACRAGLAAHSCVCLRLGAAGHEPPANDCGRRYLTLAGTLDCCLLCLWTRPSSAQGWTGESNSWRRAPTDDCSFWRRTGPLDSERSLRCSSWTAEQWSPSSRCSAYRPRSSDFN